MGIVSKRSELLFLYDVKKANPNGDPMDNNRPRIDEETGKCLVTDVRLKRTVRDYLMSKGYDGNSDPKKDIFIRDEKEGPVTGKKRSEDYNTKEEFLNKFIDARLFGAVSAPGDKSDKKKVFHFTGPVQFGMGVSLHRVKENFIKGTGGFATKEGAQQKTFREEYNISYGLIGFHGVINENAAHHTKVTEEDISELLDGLWNGTKNLLTRSKKGHTPRLLLKVTYKKPNFFIGELLERLTIEMAEDKREESLEDISDFVINTSELNATLNQYWEHIEKVEVVAKDDRIQLSEPIKTS
ncbi:MAG: type I-B CRISPR-associated protein Cas7/Csh2 [Saprospiraceae bacterium]|nr:MAG: type I-B CRISPR-associated protein Cas7/Csh2 [Saprospiraceae bacterium]